MKKYLSTILTQLILFSLVGCSTTIPSLHGNPYQNAAQAPDFSMPSTVGQDFVLRHEVGRVTLLYFGYTSCPDICPATLAQLHSVLSDLGIDQDQVQVVMVTVDPARDTLAVLKEYLAHFGSNFIGLRAEGTTLDDVLAAYGVYAAIDPESDPVHYSMIHTARVFVIDSDGRLVTNYSFDTPSEDIRLDLEALLELEG